MNNKIITILLSLGALIMLFFAADLISNRQQNSQEFDFSGIMRPIFYNESPVQGSENAKLVIYEYGDFSCLFCKSMSPIISQIMEKYGAQVQYVWKDFPFLSETSSDAAIAARCAGKQGKFWEYHDWLFERQEALTSVPFDSGARSLDLDVVKFTSCILDDTIPFLVERDFQEGHALGVNETPTIVIGDVALVGVVEFGEIERAILTELQKNK